MTYALSRTRTALPIPQDVQARAEWGHSFSGTSGFAFVIHKKYWMSVFIRRELLSRKLTERLKIISEENVIAHCVSCKGEDWEVRAEPTDKGRAGFIVYTAKGKPIGSGELEVGSDSLLQFSSKALYPGITNKISFDYTIGGKATNTGGWEITASVKVSDSR